MVPMHTFRAAAGGGGVAVPRADLAAAPGSVLAALASRRFGGAQPQQHGDELVVHGVSERVLLAAARLLADGAAGSADDELTDGLDYLCLGPTSGVPAGALVLRCSEPGGGATRAVLSQLRALRRVLSVGGPGSHCDVAAGPCLARGALWASLAGAPAWANAASAPDDDAGDDVDGGRSSSRVPPDASLPGVRWSTRDACFEAFLPTVAAATAPQPPRLGRARSGGGGGGLRVYMGETAPPPCAGGVPLGLFPSAAAAAQAVAGALSQRAHDSPFAVAWSAPPLSRGDTALGPGTNDDDGPLFAAVPVSGQPVEEAGAALGGAAPPSVCPPAPSSCSAAPMVLVARLVAFALGWSPFVAGGAASALPPAVPSRECPPSHPSPCSPLGASGDCTPGDPPPHDLPPATAPLLCHGASEGDPGSLPPWPRWAREAAAAATDVGRWQTTPAWMLPPPPLVAHGSLRPFNLARVLAAQPAAGAGSQPHPLRHLHSVELAGPHKAAVYACAVAATRGGGGGDGGWEGGGGFGRRPGDERTEFYVPHLPRYAAPCGVAFVVLAQLAAPPGGWRGDPPATTHDGADDARQPHAEKRSPLLLEVELTAWGGRDDCDESMERRAAGGAGAFACPRPRRILLRAAARELLHPRDGGATLPLPVTPSLVYQPHHPPRDGGASTAAGAQLMVVLIVDAVGCGFELRVRVPHGAAAPLVVGVLAEGGRHECLNAGAVGSQHTLLSEVPTLQQAAAG